MSNYTQLTREQRYQIYALMKARVCQTEIAMVVCVHKSTISREIRRNRGLYIFKECGTEYCDKADHYDYQLYLAINDINKIQPILAQIR